MNYLILYRAKLLSNTDCNTVHIVLLERLNAATLRLLDHAALSNTLSCECVVNSLSTASSNLIVECSRTCTLICITSQSDLSIWVLLHVLYDLSDLSCLRLSDVCVTDWEEDITTEVLLNYLRLNLRSWSWSWLLDDTLDDLLYWLWSRDYLVV